MGKGLYCSHVANDVYATVYKCCFCAQTLMHVKKQKKLKTLFPDEPLAYVGLQILEPLPKKKQNSQFFVVMKDLYTNLTKAVPAPKTNTTTVAPSF